jgi:hypothetical protein
MVVLAGCSVNGDREQLALPKPIELTVVNGADTSMALPDVAVSVTTETGQLRSLGVTDQFGRISVRRSDIRGTSAELILFCHYGFFCGAIRTRESRLREFDEYLIALAPNTVR